MTTQEKIDVLEADAAGEIIQFRRKDSGWTFGGTGLLQHKTAPWEDEDEDGLDFNFGTHDYRVKPQPREFVVTRSTITFPNYLGSPTGRVVNQSIAAAEGSLPLKDNETIRVREILD